MTAKNMTRLNGGVIIEVYKENLWFLHIYVGNCSTNSIGIVLTDVI